MKPLMIWKVTECKKKSGRKRKSVSLQTGRKTEIGKAEPEKLFSTYGINCYFYRSMCGIPIFDGLDCAIRSGICFF